MLQLIFEESYLTFRFKESSLGCTSVLLLDLKNSGVYFTSLPAISRNLQKLKPAIKYKYTNQNIVNITMAKADSQNCLEKNFTLIVVD